MSYLKKIGLKADPFLTPVAEQEISASEDISLFFRYYSHLGGSDFIPGKNIRALGLNKHIFVYGRPGSGKTTTRLALEAECRRRFDGTLVITYLLGEDLKEALSADEHGSRLARSLAIDLIIQIIEHISTLPPMTPEKINLLREQVQQGGAALQWMITSLAEGVLENNYQAVPKAPGSHAGLGMFWELVDRYPITYVGASKALDFLLTELKHFTEPAATVPDGFEAFWHSIDTAKACGFRRALVLVDGVDARERSPENMFTLIKPLIDQLGLADKNKVFFKFFLPTELHDEITKYRRGMPDRLNSKIVDATMNWNPEALRQLLHQRFRAAGLRTIISLDVLAEDDLKLGLERPVIELAKGSPRRMLAVVSELINAHITRPTKKIKIDQEDWNNMEKCVDRLPAA